jgi:geranylgeranyl pyrophosphate synthase/uncharacterized protein with NAD-binding domain and iron-sulfur cluster
VPRVIVLGSGIGGLSAAHELAERGFEVVLVEKTGIPGGKARSSPVMPVGASPWPAEPRYPRATSLADPVAWVPGEHGFRFFPGFYRHVVDSMARIPTPGGISAADHLVPISRCGLTQYDKPTFNFPMRFPRTPADIGTAFAALIAGFSAVTDLQAGELAHFGARVWQILTSCPERRLGEYEKIGWWEFIDADVHSVAYQKFLAAGITRSLVAAHAETASTRTIGNIFLQLLLDVVDPLVATSDRVLDGPTNQTWIYPWLLHVRALGVTYMAETAVTEIHCRGGRVTGVRVERDGRGETIAGDYYVCALPVERFVPLLTPDLLSADPGLEGARRLTAECLEWMNGVQFYFNRPVRLVRGHMNHIDSEWALTSISQVDVWRAGTMDRYGPRNIQGIVSVDVSDWDALAPDGRSATEHSREDVCREVWRQLKRSVNVPGEEETLRDEELIGWFIDTDIDRDPSDPARLANAEPLLVNLTGSWQHRPEAVTKIPNFFLASDYVRTHTDLATMESANEAARRAVNGILDASGWTGRRCQIWPLHEPAVFEPLREYDRMRFGLGMPWDPGLLPVATSALKAADPLLQPVASLISSIAPVAIQAQRLADHLEEKLGVPAKEKLAQGVQEQVRELRDRLEAAVPVAALERPMAAVARSMGAEPGEVQRRNERPRSGTPDGPLGFADRLQWYQSMAGAALERSIPRTEPGQYLYGPIREFVLRPSKGLRPALCLATCLAHGGRAEQAVPSAAGIELLHNAFLVHDDIEDGSESRRGRPTLHRSEGTPIAVNIGDAMNALSMRMFRDNVALLGPDAAIRIFDDVDHMLLESLEGQAMELGWVRDNNCRVDTDDYLRLVLKKTAWYSFIHPMRIGGIVAGLDDEALTAFHQFGYLLGAAFQIQDDVLNLTGDEARYGKEIGGDLWEGKRTLPLAHALAHATASPRRVLEEFLSRPRTRRLPRQILDVHRILDDHGSIEWARCVAAALARAAADALPAAFARASEGPDLSFIRSLSDYLVTRDL